MAAAGYRLPPLYLAAWAIGALGIVGLAGVWLLHPPAHLYTGLVYLSFACIAFGAGEILNHPKPPQLPTEATTPPADRELCRRRNPCSLGNLFDIGGLLLFFVGLSALLFPR
ncbi:hypothetical protein JCM39068_10000 [Desulfocastanea catecholica]